MFAIYLSAFTFSCKITSKLLLLYKLLDLNTFTTPVNPSPVFSPTLNLFGKLMLRLASRFAMLLWTYVKKYLSPLVVSLVIVVYPSVSSLILIGLTRMPPIIKSFAISKRFIDSVVVFTKFAVPRNVAFSDTIRLFATMLGAVIEFVAFIVFAFSVSRTSTILKE